MHDGAELTSLRQGYGGPPKRFARRRKFCPTGVPAARPAQRGRYSKLTRVVSSSTSGRTNLYAAPARGTSTRIGSTPAIRRWRLNTFDEGACAYSSRAFDSATGGTAPPIRSAGGAEVGAAEAVTST